MYARVTTIQMNPERLDEAVAQVEEQDLPTWKSLDGFRGFTLVLNRSTGEVVGISYWDSREQMEASEEAVLDSRRRAAETGGASSEPAVERYEVALDTFVRGGGG
jgi:heme-degrading monooxygenase HmoA